MLASLLTSLLLASSALSCADHDYHSYLRKRADAPPTGGAPSTAGSSNSTSAAWAYEASYDWGRISTAYHLCQDGSTQAPIPLRTDQGLSLRHVPSFNRYNMQVTGVFRNWGYGPAMTFAHPEGNYTTLPSFTFEEEKGQNETVYMSGWHIHAPADHTVQGQRSRVSSLPVAPDLPEIMLVI